MRDYNEALRKFVELVGMHKARVLLVEHGISKRTAYDICKPTYKSKIGSPIGMVIERVYGIESEHLRTLLKV